MRITVRFFALARDRAGISETALSLPSQATVADAERALIVQFPALEKLMARAAFALNREYTSRSAILNDHDELALLPPVSGG